MKHYLFYGCQDKYERGPIELLKSICIRDTADFAHYEINALEHEKHYRASFDSKVFSSLHILVLILDPANGVTEVLRNEYSENPLRVRTIINPEAKGLGKRKNLLAGNTAMTMPQYSNNVFVDAEEAHSHDNEEPI